MLLKVISQVELDQVIAPTHVSLCIHNSLTFTDFIFVSRTLIECPQTIGCLELKKLLQ